MFKKCIDLVVFKHSDKRLSLSPRNVNYGDQQI